MESIKETNNCNSFFSIDSNKLFNLEEESLLLNEINHIEIKINHLFKNSSTSTSTSTSASNKKKPSENYSTLFNKSESKDTSIKYTPTSKEFFNLINSNKSKFEKNCKRISRSEPHIIVLFKEYTFLSNLTKMRFINFHKFTKNKTSKLLCYFAKKEERRFKISIAEFDLNQEKLQTSELFWKNVAFLYE